MQPAMGFPASSLFSYYLLRDNQHLTYRASPRRILFMLSFLRPATRACSLKVLCFLLFVPPMLAEGAEKTKLRVEDYQIDAQLQPEAHKLVAKAKVKFTALEDLNTVTFLL